MLDRGDGESTGIASAGSNSFALHLATMLGRAHRAAEAAVDARLRHCGLNAAQLRVLEALTSTGGRPSHVGSVARVLGLHHTTVGPLIGALESRGLLRRVPDADDRRRSAVVLTARGVARIEDARRALDPERDGA